MPRFKFVSPAHLKIASALCLTLFAADCSSARVRDDARFSYENLYQDRYVRGNGGIIPITLERGESYSGTISKDQKYLYFSSNTTGNYDIYLRDLGDVFSVPVVTTVTNQREPAISPDGKYLVYVDDELDPDGDIILLKVNPEKLIELYRDRRQPGDEWFASRSKNLTNSEKNRIRARDANPAWSPDGKWIAYSSDLVPQNADDLGPGAGALQNIWLMPVDSPEEKRQLTIKGGVMPSFSEDGSKIVYISYQQAGSFGAVYEIEIVSGKTRQLTSGHALDFYPTYAPGAGIVLTRIAADTNGDGQIDRKDAGQIIRIFPEAATVVVGKEALVATANPCTSCAVVDDDDYIPLTSPGDHVFDSRVSNFIGGSVVHAQLKGEDINVAFIPLSGAIPIKPDIRQQQMYLQTLGTKKNQARFCMGLQQLPSAFRASPDLVVYDAISALRRGRCDKDAGRELAEYLADAGQGELALYRLLNDIALINPEYADLRRIVTLEPITEVNNANKYFSEVVADESLWQAFTDEYEAVDYTAIRSFVMHEHAQLWIRQGRHKEAAETIRRITRENPSYLALDELLLANGIADSSTLPAAELLYLIADQPDVNLIRNYFPSGKTLPIAVRPHVRRRAENFLLEFFDQQYVATNEDAQEQFLAGFPEATHRTLHAMFALSTARDHENEELLEESIAAAQRTKSITAPGSLLHFYAATLAAENAEATLGAEAAMAQYSAAISEYRDSETPENVKDIMAKAALFYGERARIALSNGNDKAAAAEYQALLDLYLSAHANKLKKEIPAGDLLDYALNLDQIALRAATKDADLLENILKFYDDRIDLARRFLVTEFMFGRGFLRAQLGIQRHLAAEADGLSKSEKKEVFESFRKAETDLNWCFFANARFADAYIMLGWMYQFIDEKREVVLDAASGKKDREVFESLYRSYFPDYLFEKNIRLYQKTLVLFAQSGSARVRNSFHLNIANNYFLLNNYSQAEEHYASILDAKGVPDFQFETPEQQIMFYYHFGRSLYFSGKNEAASRYLRFVESNLNARYPITGVSAERQRINQGRREIAYKTFALNIEYSQNTPAAIAYNQTILDERQAVAAEAPAAMIYLELARLQLKQGDFNASLENTSRAEVALAKEESVAIPKFKLRVKWFWVYEPWSWLVGLVYKLSYDDVYIGDNHLAFELPTVNRYQLLYSIRAEIYRNKGLLQEASIALSHLVEYAEKDNTKHGAETLSAAVSRRAELEFSLKNWDAARDLYTQALKSAEKSENAAAAFSFRKNIQFCKLRKLESDVQPLAEKVRMAQADGAEVHEYRQKILDARLKAARELQKKKADPSKADLTQEDIDKITTRVRTELQPLLYFEGLNRAHEAELIDFRGRMESHAESFDQFLERKKQDFDRFASALKYFRGYTRETLAAVDPVFEPDIKNNGLRLKLAMNRAKILQEMDLFDESIAELKEIQEKSQEFRAQREYTVATYRLHRVHEDAGRENLLSVAPYENLISYFSANAGFLQDNTELFERTCNIVIEKALSKRNYLQAIKVEDLKRQQASLPMYFDELKLFGEKESQFSQLLIAEQRRRTLEARIRAGRLARQSVLTLEKELSAAEAVVLALRRKLRQPDRLDYRYETFFSPGISEGELARAAQQGIIYVMKPGDQMYFVYARSQTPRAGSTWRLEMLVADREKASGVQLAEYARKMQAKIIVLAPQLLNDALADESLKKLSLQTSLRATINFSNNPDLAKRNLLQLAKSGSLLSFTTGNEVDYGASQPLTRARLQSDVNALSMHRNVIDYEAELARKGGIIDTAPLTPAALFNLRSNPNFIVSSRQSRNALQPADEFRYAAAVDLYFSAMGAGQVFHTFAPRKQAKLAIEQYLNEGTALIGGMITGNPVVETGPAGKLNSLTADLQRKTYSRKIKVARTVRAYAEAASYAEDAVSLFPGASEFQFQAADLHLLQGQRHEAQPHMDAVAAVISERPEYRESYAKLLLRAGEYRSLAVLLADYPALRKSIARDPIEYEGLMQLRALADGNLNLLNNPFVWEIDEKINHAGMITALANKMRNEPLKNEICNAAIEALEFRLIVKSCKSSLAADREDLQQHNRIVSYASGGAQRTKNTDAELLKHADHAVSLLDGAFYSDAVSVSQKIFASGSAGSIENLLALSLLRTLASRKAGQVDSANIAKLLATYGTSSFKHATNNQAKKFYGLLSEAEIILVQGAAAAKLSPEGENESSGVVAARNLLLRLGLSVKPAVFEAAQLRSSGLVVDTQIERELQQYFREIAGNANDAKCPVGSCNLLIKYYITTGKQDVALRLLLQSQQLYAGKNMTTTMQPGLFGYAALFVGENYRWYFDGGSITFENLPGASLLTELAAPAGARYMLYNANNPIFAKEKNFPGRDAVIVDKISAIPKATTGTNSYEISFASPNGDTLHSSLVAKWGNSKKPGQATVVIKPALNKTPGVLHIYSDRIAIAGSTRLRPSGYHLFCDTTESYSAFTVFAQALIENLITSKMSIEDAYFAAFKPSKGKQASTRPLYYLYRN